MNTNLLAWLLSTGLDDQRARLYLSALGKGEATAKELAEDMGLNRTAVYDNLRVLEERGFAYMKASPARRTPKRRRYLSAR